VKVYLVRHAKAQRRLGWEHADAMRPLSPGGHDQALGGRQQDGGVSERLLRREPFAEPERGVAEALDLSRRRPFLGRRGGGQGPPHTHPTQAAPQRGAINRCHDSS